MSQSEVTSWYARRKVLGKGKFGEVELWAETPGTPVDIKGATTGCTAVKKFPKAGRTKEQTYEIIR